MATGNDTWTVLALVRHGQSQGNLNRSIGGHSATPLTDLGHQQARETAAALAEDFMPTRVIASDLMRAKQTAIPIAQECGVDMSLDARLRERSLGVFDGMLFDDAQARDPAFWERLRNRDVTACPEGGETLDTVFQRVKSAISDIVEHHAGERVVVVSHGLALFHAFAYICGLGSPAAGLQVFTLVDNCSITRVTHRGSYWYLSTLNECRHLSRA